MWTVAVVAMTTMVVNLVWAANNRGFGTLNIDETGLTAHSYHLGDELSLGHVGALVSSLNGYEPLVPVLTAPLFALGLDHPNTPIIGQVLLAALCGVATAAMVKRVTRNPAIAIVAGFVALTVPMTLHATRVYGFGLGAATGMALAVWALLASDRGRRTGAMAAFGGAVGAMLLARAMMVGMLPCLAAAAFVQVERSQRTLRNLGIALGMGVAIAGPWWSENWRVRWAYLTEFGYGDKSANIGHEPSLILGPISKAVDLISSFGPLVALCGVAITIAAARRGGLLGRLRRPWTSRERDVVSVAVVVVGGYASLSTTINHGLHFTLPLAYPLIVVIAAIASQATTRMRRGAAVIFVGSGLAALTLSLVGTMPADGLGAGLWALIDPSGNGNEASTGDDRLDQAWWSANRRVIRDVREVVPTGRQINYLMVGDGSERMNSGTLLLAARIDQSPPGFIVGGLDLSATPDAWDDELELEPAGAVTVIIVFEPRSGALGRSTEAKRFLTHSLAGDWSAAERYVLPDGGTATVLTRESPISASSSRR